MLLTLLSVNAMESHSASHSAPDPAPAHPALRLLVVEDNPTNQKVILRQLQSLGYEADLAPHGQAALDRMAATFYAVVFMDCRLPGIDGYSATRLIRQREQESGQGHAIIIALTASDEPQDQMAAMAAGMDDFLVKPLRRETLAATLNRWQSVALSELKRRPPAPVDQSLPPLNAALTELQFDLEQLHQISDQSIEFEQELLQLFLDDTRLQVQQLQQAGQQQDWTAVQQIAHHIKGASASVGARLLETMAEEIERQSRYQQFAAPERLRTLEQEFERVENRLRAVL